MAQHSLVREWICNNKSSLKASRLPANDGPRETTLWRLHFASAAAWPPGRLAAGRNGARFCSTGALANNELQQVRLAAANELSGRPDTMK